MEERGKRQFDAAVQGESSLSHDNEKKSKLNIRKINSKTSSTENVRDEESRSSTSEENSQTTKSRFLFHI